MKTAILYIAHRNVFRLSFMLILFLFAFQTNAQTRLQSATGNTGLTAQVAITVSLGNAPQNGNTLIAVISGRTTTTNNISSITQSGTTWVRAVSRANTVDTNTEIWYTTAINNAGTTITITQGAARLAAAVIMEYSGLLYAAPLDRTASNVNGSNSTAASTGATATTTSGPQLWIGGIGLRSSGFTLSSITNSFSVIDNAFSTNATAGNNARVYALERRVTTSGAASTGGTISSSSRYSGAIATFKRLITGFTPAFLCDASRTDTITGEGFTGATAVSFNGTPASSFTVNSNTRITATAPAAATSGLISVTNSAGYVGYSESPLIIRKMTQPTANTTNTTCPSVSNGALTLTNIPIALNFNATQSQQVNLGAPLLNNLAGFTVEGWIKTTSYNRNSFFGQDNAVEIGFADDGSIELWSEGLQTNLYSSTSAYPRDGQWHHVAGVGNGQNMFIYIDGILVAQRTHNALSAPTNYGSSAINARIGAFVWNASTPNYFNGQMLKVGFWNRALTSQEIVEKASMPYQYLGNIGNETGLIAGYNFFEGTGTSLSRIPAGGAGTLTGSPTSTWTDISTYSWTKVDDAFTATTKNISGIGIGTYNLSVTIGGCATNTNSFAVGSDGTESTPATSMSGTSPVCAESQVVLTLNGGTLGTAASWKWYSGSCGTNEITTGITNGGRTLTIIPSTTTTYYARAEGTCNTTACVAYTVVVNAAGTWLGITTDWNDAQNWCGTIPTSSTDVIIPAGVPFQPTIGVNEADAICNSLTINNGASVTFTGVNNTLTMHGNLINNGTFTANNSTVIFNGTSSILGESITTFNNLTINSDKTLIASSNTINITGNWTKNINGTFTNNGGTIVFNGTAAQDIAGVSIFNNLTVDNAAGVVGKSDLTVNGVLNLASANPSDTLAALHMNPVYNVDILTGSNTLFMGAEATTIGVGDVNGRIVRDTIIANVDYTFGNANTTIRFYGTGTLPTQMKFIPRIGVRHTTKNNTVKRTYQIVRTGGATPTLFSLKLKYLESELDGINENNLVYWDHHIPYDGTSPHEHGKTELNTNDNTITLSGHGIRYLAENEYFGEEAFITNPEDPNYNGNLPQSRAKIWMISGKESTTDFVWLGAAGSSWDALSNWEGNEIPNDTANVIIRNATGPGNPVIPAGETRVVKSITIESDRILTMENGSTLEIHGSQADNDGTPSWNNLGTFVPNTSTVEFKRNNASIAGTTQFYNISNMADSTLVLLNGSQVSVSGTFTNNGAINGSFNGPSTFIYNGADQTVQANEHSNYHHLTLSGTGTKTIQSSNLVIKGDLTLSAAIDAQSSTIVFDGTSAQTLSGTSSSALNNVTLNNANGLTLSKNQTANGTLTLTNGLITTGSNILTLGCDANTSGQSSSSYINGILARDYCGVSSKFFPIGKGGAYRPLNIERTTGASGLTTIQSEQFEATITGVLPANTTAFANRFWTITQPEGSQSYKIQIDGTDFTPNGTAVILKGDGNAQSTLTSLAATTPNYTTTNAISSFSDFTLGSECPVPIINNHPLSTTVCEGSAVANFAINYNNPPPGVEESGYSYQWQVSATEVSGDFVNISNGSLYSNVTTTVLSINNPAYVLNGYAYRVVLTNLCGSQNISNAAILTVNPQPQGSLSGEMDICKGAIGSLTWTATLGTGPYTIIYNNGAGNQTVSDIVSGTPFPVGAIAANTTFTLVSVTDASGCTRSTGFTQGSAEITVNPYITWTGGAGDTDATRRDWFTASNWCGGVPTLADDVIIPNVPYKPVIDDAGAVTKSMIIENLSSVTIDGDYTLQMAGSLTNNGSLLLDVGVLDINTGNSFVENNGLIETRNTTATPIPNTGAYGGTVRFNGAAQQTLFGGTFKDIIVENAAGVVMAVDAIVNASGTLEVKAGSKIDIGTGRSITANKVVNSAGTGGIILRADATNPNGSLIFNNTIEEPVQATVQMYSPAYWTTFYNSSGALRYTYYWQFMGIPIKKLDNVNPTLAGAFVRRYNEAGAGTASSTPLLERRWIQLQNGNPMTAVTGYELVQAEAKTYTFAGELFHSDIDTTLSYTPARNPSLVNTPSGQYPGQHILSNPYPSAIRISDIIFGHNTDSTVYMYNTGSFLNWQDNKSNTGNSSGQYIAASLKTAGEAGIPSEIPPMQGFLVRTNKELDGSIYINYNNTKTINTTKQRAPRQMSWLRLNMHGVTSGAGDVTWLFSSPETTRGHDNGWDGIKLADLSGTALLYSWNETGFYQINALPDIHETEIGFRANTIDTRYTINFEHANMFSQYNELYFFDRETGDIIDISESGTEYEFDAYNQSPASRFMVLTSRPSTTDDTLIQDAASGIKVFSADKSVFVDNKSNTDCKLELFDISGQRVYNGYSSANSLSRINLTLVQGSYVVKLSSNKLSINHKLIIK